MSGLKMAKASPTEIDQLRQFFLQLEDISERLGFDYSHAQVAEWVEQNTDNIVPWRRVIEGYEVLFTNCCDPLADCLEFNRSLTEAIAKAKNLDELMQATETAGGTVRIRVVEHNGKRFLTRVPDIEEAAQQMLGNDFEELMIQGREQYRLNAILNRLVALEQAKHELTARFMTLEMEAKATREAFENHLFIGNASGVIGLVAFLATTAYFALRLNGYV